MPDNHTRVLDYGKRMRDSDRYKMVGNSMSIPVVRWIGVRLKAANNQP